MATTSANSLRTLRSTMENIFLHFVLEDNLPQRSFSEYHLRQKYIPEDVGTSRFILLYPRCLELEV